MKQTILITVFCLIFAMAFSQGRYYTNPVSDSIFIADPFVLRFNETYYLYGSSASDGFKYWISKNLVNWEPGRYAFQKDKNTWGINSFWAPEVIHYQNKFYLIYSANGPTMFGEGLRLCIAESNQPEGPFKDIYAPLFDFAFSCIDGHIFIDDDQKIYLYYEKVGAVGEFWKQEGYLWGAIFGVELTNDLSGLKSEPVLCMYPEQEWEGPQSMRARSTEGMTVLKNKGVYYMTYSANEYTDPNYSVGFATASKPLGLWTKYPNNPILKKDLSNKVSGPGHNCIIKSPDNTELFMVYHTHANANKPNYVRVLNIDRMEFQADGSLKVNGPTRTPQLYPSGAK